MHNWLSIRALATLLFAVLLASCSESELTPTSEQRDALAPTGVFRVGLYQGSPTSLIGSPDSPDAGGVGFELGRELARRLMVPFEAVVFSSNAQVHLALREGEVDAAFTNATSERAQNMDFGPPYLVIEYGYLVPAGSPIVEASEIDRPGVRVGVTEASTTQSRLTRELLNAIVISAPTVQDAGEMLSRGEIDAFATNKAILFELSDQLNGTRVVEGGYGTEQHAVAIPKGRDVGLPFVRSFTEAVMREGVVDAAIERAGLRGVLSETGSS